MDTSALREAGLTPVGRVRVSRDAAGGPIEQHPLEGHARAADLELHAWGRGPFCRLSVAGLLGQPGVYAFVDGDDAQYIGSSVNLVQRFSAVGYGAIQARNCFKGGQLTNCKVNHLVLTRSRTRDALQLWVSVTADQLRVEHELIALLKPPWNGPGPKATLERPLLSGRAGDAVAPSLRGADPGIGGYGRFDEVWRRIVANAGQPGFETRSGKPADYEIDRNAVLVQRVTGGRIPREHFERALERVPLDKVGDVPKDCWGPSYVFAILSDPRIRHGLW